MNLHTNPDEKGQAGEDVSKAPSMDAWNAADAYTTELERSGILDFDAGEQLERMETVLCCAHHFQAAITEATRSANERAAAAEAENEELAEALEGVMDSSTSLAFETAQDVRNRRAQRLKGVPLESASHGV